MASENPFAAILTSTADKSLSGRDRTTSTVSISNAATGGSNENEPLVLLGNSRSHDCLTSLVETPSKQQSRSVMGKSSSPATVASSAPSMAPASAKKLSRPSSFRVISESPAPALRTPQKQSSSNIMGRCRSSSKEIKSSASTTAAAAAAASARPPQPPAAVKTLDKALASKNFNAGIPSQPNKAAILAQQRNAVRKIRTRKDSIGYSASETASEEEVEVVRRRQSMAIAAEIRTLVARAEQAQEQELGGEEGEQQQKQELEQPGTPAQELVDCPPSEAHLKAAEPPASPAVAATATAANTTSPAGRASLSIDMGRKRESLALDSALISKMLPRKVCVHVRQGKPVPPEFFSNVSIFFSDVVGFTNISAAVEPLQVIRLLNTLFTVMDYVTSLFPLYKVETIGDAYMVASGLPEPNPENCQALADFAILVSHAVQVVPSPLDGQPIRIRMGMHSGDVMAGVVGSMMPRYCLFGDTVNTASRMESNGEPGRIHVSEAMAQQLLAGGRHAIEERGEIEVKGKGTMRTFWLVGAGEGNDVSDEASIRRVVEASRELVAHAHAFGEEDEEE